MRKHTKSLFLALLLCAQTAAALDRVVDDAGLLSSAEKAALETRIAPIAAKYDFDVVVVTANGLGGKTPKEYADDFFDYKGYGLGADRDGVLFLIGMEDRDWWISTSGRGIQVFTDYGIGYIGEKMLPSLKEGDYAGAFAVFAAQTERFLAQAASGAPFDLNNRAEKTNPLPFLLIAAALSALVSFLISLGLKASMKTAVPRSLASEYLDKNSFNLTIQKDVFLYSQVSKVKIETKSGSSGGGSSTHSGSSGRSHGGGGGKF